MKQTKSSSQRKLSNKKHQQTNKSKMTMKMKAKAQEQEQAKKSKKNWVGKELEMRKKSNS